jgi:hypothetical protein
MPSSVESKLNNFINPNMVSKSQSVPNGMNVTGFGNIPRNAFRGPAQQDWDFSVAKTFRFAERHQFQFRTDFFNLFNHPVFNLPSVVDVGAARSLTNGTTFGQINTTVLPARLIQFGLKYSF